MSKHIIHFIPLPLPLPFFFLLPTPYSSPLLPTLRTVLPLRLRLHVALARIGAESEAYADVAVVPFFLGRVAAIGGVAQFVGAHYCGWWLWLVVVNGLVFVVVVVLWRCGSTVVMW